MSIRDAGVVQARGSLGQLRVSEGPQDPQGALDPGTLGDAAVTLGLSFGAGVGHLLGEDPAEGRDSRTWSKPFSTGVISALPERIELGSAQDWKQHFRVKDSRVLTVATEAAAGGTGDRILGVGLGGLFAVGPPFVEHR